MRPADMTLGRAIKQKLISFSEIHELKGVADKACLECLIEQIIDSIRRVKYVTTIGERVNDAGSANPRNGYFDPLKAAAWHKQNGNINEAFWLVFLSIHFGKNKRTKWLLTQNVYGRLGHSLPWNWERTSSDPESFRDWLREKKDDLKEIGKFGNHRKYESLNDNCTGEAVQSYVNWIGPTHDHLILINNILEVTKANRREAFDGLYNSMNVTRFGRTARFDYLTMIGKLGLAPIEPGSTYMHGATGPLTGARLLFGGDKNAQYSESELISLLNDLDSYLELYFGMQVLEDALCNWQKSPDKYKYFAG